MDKTFRQILQDINYEIGNISQRMTKVEESLSGDFGIVEKIKENSASLKDVREKHFALEKSYNSEKTKIYTVVSLLSVGFGFAANEIKKLLFH